MTPQLPWIVRNLWLIPGQRVTAAVSAAFLTITTAAYKSYLDGSMGRSILVWKKVR